MTTVALTSGATWTPSSTGNSDFYNATNVTVICFGAGGTGGNSVGGCCQSGGAGGTSGGASQITNFSAPASGSISIQIPAGNSASQCWFSSSGTVAANSKSNSTTGAVGSTLKAGNAGAIGGGVHAGSGGGGCPGISTQGTAGSGGSGGCCGSGGSGGTAGTPNYTATAGGTFGPGAGGGGGTGGNGTNGGNYGGGAGGGGWDSGCNSQVGGTGAPGLIIVIYTPASGTTQYPLGFNMPMLGMCVAGLVTAALRFTHHLRTALCFLRPAFSA